MAANEVRKVTLEKVPHNKLELNEESCKIQQKEICHSDHADTTHSQSVKRHCTVTNCVQEIILELITQVCYMDDVAPNENSPVEFENKNDDKLHKSNTGSCKKFDSENEVVRQIVFDIVSQCCEQLDQNKMMDKEHQCDNDFGNIMNDYISESNYSVQSMMNSSGKKGKSIDDGICVDFKMQYRTDSDSNKDSMKNIGKNTNCVTHFQDALSQLDTKTFHQLSHKNASPDRKWTSSLIDIDLALCENQKKNKTNCALSSELESLNVDQMGLHYVKNENEHYSSNECMPCVKLTDSSLECSKPDKMHRTSGNTINSLSGNSEIIQNHITLNIDDSQNNGIPANINTNSRMEIAKVFCDCVDEESLKCLQGKKEIIDTQSLSIKPEEDINIGTAHVCSGNHIDCGCCAIGKCESEIDFTMEQMDIAQVADKTGSADKGNYIEVGVNCKVVAGVLQKETCIFPTTLCLPVISPILPNCNNDVKSDCSALIEIENKNKMPAENKYELTNLTISETCYSQQVKKQGINADVQKLGASILSDKLTFSSDHDLFQCSADAREVKGTETDSAHNFKAEDILTLNKLPSGISIKTNVDRENKICSAQQLGYQRVAEVSASNEFLHCRETKELDKDSLSTVQQQPGTSRMQISSSEHGAEEIFKENISENLSTMEEAMKQNKERRGENSVFCQNQESCQKTENISKKSEFELTIQYDAKESSNLITPVSDKNYSDNCVIKLCTHEDEPNFVVQVSEHNTEKMHFESTESYNESITEYKADNEGKETPVNVAFISALEYHSSQSSESSTSADLQELSQKCFLKRKFESGEKEMVEGELPMKQKYVDFVNCGEVKCCSDIVNVEAEISKDQRVPGEHIDEENPVNDTLFHGSVSPVYKWKYAPSVDADSTVPRKVTNDDTEKLTGVQPLPLCKRNLRIGLSKKQRIQPLHAKFQ